MEDYLQKFGFMPEDIGVEQFFASAKPTGASVKTNQMRPQKQLKFDNTKLKDLPLTIAYVPMQQSTEKYDPAMALNCGTLFPDLNKPFTGRNNTKG